MPEYIERGTAEKAIMNIAIQSSERHRRAYARAENAIHFVPAADAEPVRHGRWLPTATGKYGCVCSACKIQSDNDFNYCPECGAKMDLEEAK